jgi:hypothetical protein
MFHQLEAFLLSTVCHLQIMFVVLTIRQELGFCAISMWFLMLEGLTMFLMLAPDPFVEKALGLII